MLGNSRKAQIKEWGRYFEIERKGNGYIFLEEYKNVHAKIDNRKGNSGKSKGSWGNNQPYKNGHPQMKIKEEEWVKNGVYKITLNNDVYIGSTTIGFKGRFLEHTHNSNTLPTLETIRNGAIFEIIWIDTTDD